MDNKKIAKELVKIAKELTAHQKIWVKSDVKDDTYNVVFGYTYLHSTDVNDIVELSKIIMRKASLTEKKCGESHFSCKRYNNTPEVSVNKGCVELSVFLKIQVYGENGHEIMDLWLKDIF